MNQNVAMKLSNYKKQKNWKNKQQSQNRQLQIFL